MALLGLSDKNISFPSETGITAGTTQSQGQAPLTLAFNLVETVANENDVVTLAAAIAGHTQVVANAGAKTLQIFPASGNYINGGAINTSVTLPPGEMLIFKFLSASRSYTTSSPGLSSSLTFNEPAADETAGTQSIFDMVTVGENVVFGDLLYLKSDAKWWKANADDPATMPGLRMALAGISADASGIALVKGRVRNDAWNWTIGGLIYGSITPGAMSQVVPVASGDQVQVIGVPYHADKMFFDPSSVLVELA